MGLKNLFKSAWNIFQNKDPTMISYKDLGMAMSTDSNKHNNYYNQAQDKSLLKMVINKMAMDAASIPIQEVIVDEEERFITRPKDSTINERLLVSANMDQTGSAFRLEAISTMLEEGTVVLVPTDADMDPDENDSFKIYELRIGHITQWYPAHVRMEVYDENDGKTKEVIMQKASLCIVTNPMYDVMNERSSIPQRIARKMALLDVIDEELNGNKLNMIIQLPYVIKTPARMEQAENRRKAIEQQLANNKYGIAYIDGTEKITQLNRPLENNLVEQVKFLTESFMNQIGITQEVINGTASPEIMNNYYNRPIDWILTAFRDEIYRKWLTTNARTRGHSIKYYRDPFRLAPINNVAEMADKFIRNEIMTKNEFRQILGMKPSSDPGADELSNPNISAPGGGTDYEYAENQNGYGEYEDQPPMYE